MLRRARAIRSLHRAVQAAAGRRGFADGAIAENAAQLSDQSILLAPRARRLFHYRACDGTTRAQRLLHAILC